MTRSVILSLEDIVEAIRDIFDFINGMDFDEFDNDKKTSSAVI